MAKQLHNEGELKSLRRNDQYKQDRVLQQVRLGILLLIMSLLAVSAAYIIFLALFTASHEDIRTLGNKIANILIDSWAVNGPLLGYLLGKRMSK